MPYRALTIARYFLSRRDDDAGELISNLKLQKLLYYSQGFHVAIFGVSNPLFSDKVYAWKHGPVVKNVYHHYSDRRSGALPKEGVPPIVEDDDETLRFLDEIHRVFGKFSAWKLREMTHREDPWLKNYEPDVDNIEIPLSDMAKYFKRHVKEN